ncbi:MAG: glycosyltransferase family 39 protein [Planctomycetota bacterium]
MSPATTKSRWASAVGAAILVLSLFATLGSRGLNEPDEGRYGEIAREMLVTGDYLVPRIKGVPHYAKPPLTYWAVAGSMAVFGFEEWALRLPGALASLLVLAFVFDWARRDFGQRVGVIAVLGLATSFHFVAMQRILTTDMIMAATVMMALWAHCRWREGGRRMFALLFWIALGLAFLTKGPVPILVVLAALVGGFRGFAGFRGLGLSWGLPMFLLLGASWYLALFRLDAGLFDGLISKEIGGRVTSGLGRSKPWWYFLPVLLLGTLPWTYLVARATFAGRAWSKSQSDRGQLALRILAHGCLWPFVMFSLSSSKLWTYLLPLMPMLAISAAAWVSSRPMKSGHPRAGLLWIAIATLTLVQVGLLVASANEDRLGHNTSYRELFESLDRNELVGAAIPRGVEPELDPPRFSASGLAVLTFRFRSPSAAIYLLQDRAEYLPNYGGGSLWEFAADRKRHRLPLGADLVRLLSTRNRLLVLTKAKHLEELKILANASVRIVAEQGEGKSRALAVLLER